MIKFFLEGSLKGLGKWLLFLGHPVIFCEGKISDQDILKHKDCVFLITSPETAIRLEKAGVKFLLLPRDNLKTQLKLCLNRLNLKPELKLNLCTLCGGQLIPVNKEDFKSLIPEKVYQRYEEFNYCPSCQKLYWEGDHVKRLQEKFQKLIS
ncbi:MAG: Uncharacterized protein XD42_1071 [Thermodesulfobacterium sp. 37_54]|jgi:uncharacterized protein with PIN domain|uniref:Mut7-C RNAse domain-containing protein n=1 Tax=Thermodesulfobacterium commune TaxID=1741 RepID=A0A101FI77_9BACT|nr:Mut7-C RNAse domain-containing protein [Thermodesulfobacterium sp.]KUJ97284.1 MAG: Uncharacterized protein XD42_1071 [Thermodesulfobacterium sp. 37_54]KUK18923.1 MAG: Uncharacterized protein XD55_1014 [Thermodesulfobacterium commune]KUK37498.1 MAG: Uncharacterized protein XD67_1208 [Thermodesulfobacterium commune]MDN5378971.1 uncharacterized protein [Thermodesulfobacterium sp.]HAA84431.1 hypothetical protein [Thermodesulfobacterium commune]